MIMIQSFMFVLPSLVFGFIITFPSLSGIYSSLFTPEMGVDTTPVPSKFAIQ
jgi:hypothetical protein